MTRLPTSLKVGGIKIHPPDYQYRAVCPEHLHLPPSPDTFEAQNCRGAARIKLGFEPFCWVFWEMGNTGPLPLMIARPEEAEVYKIGLVSPSRSEAISPEQE